MSDETTVSREPRNFDSDLEKSKTQEDSAYLDKVYKRRFGSILNGHIVEIRRAVHPQEERAGFDKVILFDNGEQITIEEKIRRNTYGHKDFHIELKSVVEKGVPGWTFTFTADWLSYYIPEYDILWILHGPPFRRAIKERMHLIEEYGYPCGSGRDSYSERLGSEWHTSAICIIIKKLLEIMYDY